MALLESGEMYLETILVLSKKHPQVRSIDVGEYMGYSKPSVSRAIGLLKNGGYVLMDKNGFLTLTEEGEQVATKIYERHTVLTKMLTGLGVSEQQQDEKQVKTIVDNIKAIKIKVKKDDSQNNAIITENDKNEIKEYIKQIYQIDLNNINVS